MTDQTPTSLDEGQQSHSSSTCVSDLPSSLIPIILVKLPIKSIIICTCVCKNWNQLILDPFFTKLYANNSLFTAMVHLQRPKSLFNPKTRDVAFRFLEIESNDYDDVISTPCNLDPLFTTVERTKTERFDKRFVGSLNGLLFVVLTPYLTVLVRRDNHYEYRSELFFVINPLTGESVVIPVIKESEEICRDSYGFGSTVDGDYYKFVRIVEYDGNDELRLDLKIITVGVDDEWRDFNDPLVLDVFVSDGVALNGALHWVDHVSDSNSIYTFDVGKEIGRHISGPSSNVLGGYLGVWGGQLCFVQENENELQFDVWSMRQYGVAESWTKDIILRSSILSRNICPVAVPRATMRNGDLLLSSVSYEGQKSLISFNPKGKNCVKLDEVYDDKDTESDLLEYAPCFSSLPGIIPGQ